MTRSCTGPLSISQLTLYRALKSGERTIEELVNIYFAGVRDGGSRSAKNCVCTQLYYMRRKLGISIKHRKVYRIEP